jgi:hypothetical protein
LVRFIDGKTAKNRNRNRIGHIAPDCGGRIVRLQCAGSQAVIAGNLFTVGYHVSTGRSADLIRIRPPFEPIVETRNAAAEIVDPVFRG